MGYRSLALAVLGLTACSEPPPPAPAVLDVAVAFDVAGDWPRRHRDLAATRHSPLKLIDTRNVADLRPVWAYALSAGFTSFDRGAGIELTPIVVAGVLYATAADRVVALNAATGTELWRYTLEGGAPSQFGVAYWSGDGIEPSRVLFTAGRRLVALDAATGRRVTQFGTDGEIELPSTSSAVPTLFEDLILVAAAGVRAYDVRSGLPVWTFAADAGADGVVAVALERSAAFTIDVDRGTLFAALAAPDADEHYGGNRTGGRVLDNALVALDVRSGRLRWQFQTVRHDLWGYDLAAAPALIDVTVGSRDVAALALPAPTGYLYLLDRTSGAPLFGVAETPMPASNVPGERSAPTQAIPIKPPPVARVSYVAADLVTAADTTDVHARRCRELIERSGGAANLGPFTPYGYREAGAAPRSTVVFPGTDATERGGVTADASLGFVFVNTTSLGTIGWIEPNAADATAAQTGDGPRSRWPYRRMSAAGDAATFAASSVADEVVAAGASRSWWPCQKPPWGQLAAVSVASGEIVWQVPLGITTGLPEGRQRTGRANRGGPITTASGLVFIGASDDRRLRAFDSRTGAELWSSELPLSAFTTPITYLGGDGRQYLAVAAAGGESVDDVASAEAGVMIAYGLP